MDHLGHSHDLNFLTSLKSNELNIYKSSTEQSLAAGNHFSSLFHTVPFPAKSISFLCRSPLVKP